MTTTFKTKGLDIELIMNQAQKAAEEFRTYNQEQTDRIVKEVYKAAFNARVKLAEMAYKETLLGNPRDKVVKNIIATRLVYEDIINRKTAGIIRADENIVEIAQPIGPLFAITPITNPTSTVLFKILIALKTRNPIIIRPHSGARKCSIEAARICYEAALKAGAPENCIQWIRRSTRDETLQMMAHRKVALILATGSVSLVRAAYRSGNPAIGIGPGNVPVYIGKSSNVRFAVSQIMLSKTFDNGTICASEQAVVVSYHNAKEVREEFVRQGAYFLNEKEKELLGNFAINKREKVMNASIIGQPAPNIAEMAGFKVPPETKLLIAELEKHQVGIDYPLSLEILAPVLAFYEVNSFKEGIEMCKSINQHGGLGHTVSIFSVYEEKIREFATVMNAGRILVNQPASFGALGGTYNMLQPSMTLACGSGGKNITTDNISVQHLMNIQRIARRLEHPCLSILNDHALNTDIDAEELDEMCKNNGKPRFI